MLSATPTNMPPDQSQTRITPTLHNTYKTSYITNCKARVGKMKSNLDPKAFSDFLPTLLRQRLGHGYRTGYKYGISDHLSPLIKGLYSEIIHSLVEQQDLTFPVKKIVQLELFNLTYSVICAVKATSFVPQRSVKLKLGNLAPTK
ncbi:hypothetical protein TNCV_3211351 [Trichonephila clavipes]|uniref:Uncharacterized protein n=1 Tax=Trichonephila clavipes TaxID=2585209 RepID=A0A8X6SAK3_TRICX|nr:hypothetical protein TNCV_3211351 [Trichonephila clavipes]